MLKAILYFFSLIYGLSFNLGKTQLIGLNLYEQDFSSLADLFRCKSTLLSIKYLGLPLKESRLLRNDWTPLTMKVNSSLTSWRAQTLITTGRIVLINSTLSALPIYYMSLFLLPSWMIQEIDKIRKNFLWSGSSFQPKKIHLVSWKEICKSHHEGGLGIKNLKTLNISLLLKWWWKLLFVPSLWSSVVMDKYYTRRLPLDLNIDPSKSSPIWKNILKLGHLFKVSLRWSLENGKQNFFWEDKWGPSLSLKSEFPLLFSSALEPTSKVALNFHRSTNTWIPKLARPLSREAHSELLRLTQLLSTYSPSSTIDLPCCSWSSGQYSSKFTYEILNLSGIKWKHVDIWNLNSPPRIKIFLWLILKEKINTKDILIRRGLTLPDPTCLFCSGLESIDHLFISCSSLRPLWKKTCLPLSPQPIPLRVSDVWSHWRLSLSRANRNQWDHWAPALSWVIWIERNNRIFHNSFADIRSLHGSAQEIMSSWSPPPRL